MTLKSQITGTMLLGGLALLAGAAGHLALTDIFHANEPDLRLEWNVLRAGALVLLAFVVCSLAVLNRVRRRL